MTAQDDMLIRKQFLRQKATEFAAGRLEFEVGVGAALTVRLLTTRCGRWPDASRTPQLRLPPYREDAA